MIRRPLTFASAGMAFLVLAGWLLPSVHAEESFQPTVKIVSYRQLLNGHLLKETEGSGTLISQNGQVLTNAHVIFNETFNKPYDAFSVCVSEDPQKMPACRFTGTLNRMDRKIDLAILKINEGTAWGTWPTTFPFLDYNLAANPKESDTVTVRGFSASGGTTINTTKGQISGFEDFNGYQYLKTDADIDAGNSGGTMLNAEGQFIGVPTYVVSYYETSGRALQLQEVKEWLALKTEPLTTNPSADKALLAYLKRLYEAETEGTYRYPTAPELSFNLPTGWRFESLGEQDFFLVQNDNQSTYLQGRIQKELFKLSLTPEQRLEKIREVIGYGTYPEQENLTLAGKPALHLWETSAYGTQHFITLPYGYHNFLIDYFIPKGEEVLENDIKTFLESLQFASPDADDSSPQTRLSVSEYPFTLQMPPGWRIEKEVNGEGRLAVSGRKTNKKESLKIHYGELPVGEKHVTVSEGLKNDLENYVPFGAKVSLKSTDLVVDGLRGWMIVYEYSSNGNQTKVASVTLQDPQYEIYLDYEADPSVFEEGFKGFIYGLKNFKTKRYAEPAPAPFIALSASQQGVYKIPEGNLQTPVNLTDIAGHRFEQNILNLVEMGVIHGFADGTFKPEDPVNRAASLKIILQALRAKQKMNGENTYVLPENVQLLKDVQRTDWFVSYVAEGLERGIIAGYPDGTFRGINTVNLAEALKMILQTFDAKVWTGETSPWYKKYFDAAYALNLLPQDFTDPGKSLTRAEIAYLVDRMVNY